MRPRWKSPVLMKCLDGGPLAYTGRSTGGPQSRQDSLVNIDSAVTDGTSGARVHLVWRLGFRRFSYPVAPHTWSRRGLIADDTSTEGLWFTVWHRQPTEAAGHSAFARWNRLGSCFDNVRPPIAGRDCIRDYVALGLSRDQCGMSLTRVDIYEHAKRILKHLQH